ncbi:KilA-N domain-containing protein [Pseudomonas nitroreducens]|uniref:KilA-N domain-containing protein n=1 Tax=Pseudomonas nitroreducens TaxID=46680 RepID=UPI003D2B96C5
MTARIVPVEFDGQSVCFNSDGWINATEAASRFGKLPNDWLRLPDTASYLEAMANCGKIPQLVRTQRGRNGGTWLHPKLAISFARWLSPEFAVWCDLQLDALLRNDNSKWEQVRQQSATSYRGMCAALAVTLEAAGRQPKAHHFMNEARLINEVVAGVFSGRDRDQLSEGELALITLMEVRNVLLLGQGKTYQERKDGLLSYVATIRGARLGGAA